MNEQQLQRYSRHLLLPELGEDGQQRLLDSRVLIVGAGGLGSPIAMYLAAGGVGTIGIADADQVSLSNLQRQVIHFTDDIGRPKVESAAEKLRRMNPDCRLYIYNRYIDEENVDEIISHYDLVIEATDSPASRYRINDACARAGKPFIIGGISGFEGQLITSLPGTATYRDVFPESFKLSEKNFNPSVPFSAIPSPSHPLPVFSPAVGILGTIMATEALKVLARIGQPLTNRLLTFNALTMQFNSFNINNEKATVLGDSFAEP